MAEVKTFRPPSSPELELEDEDTLLGKCLAATVRVESVQDRLEGEQRRLEAAWEVRSRDHETFARELTEMGRTVKDSAEQVKGFGKTLNELVEAERATGVRVRNAVRGAPVVLFVVEILRQVWDYCQATGVFR